MPLRHFILEGKRVKSVSLDKWLEWTAEKKQSKEPWNRVALDELPEGVTISTAFLLGIDRAIRDDDPNKEDSRIPLLFETKIFAERYPRIHESVWRYPTWLDAVDGHANALDFAQKYLRVYKEQNAGDSPIDLE